MNNEIKAITGVAIPITNFLDIFDLLSEHSYLSPDMIGNLLGVPVHRLSSALLGLQFAGHITGLPGNIYRINPRV